MANATNSIITGKLTGSIGKELVFRAWKGKTIVAKAPKKRTGEPTTAQAETQEKFFMASRYAKAILSNADPDLAAAYAASLRPRQNLYSRALTDFMSSPVVKQLDTRNYDGAIGSTIQVRAIDDFRVTTVRVEIYDASGALHESGNAVQNLNGLDWTYTAQLALSTPAGARIKAIATDVPGNEGSLETIL